MERVRKVAAVVLRGEGVLVFEHPSVGGGMMVQLPAGTVEAGEEPEAAAVRELAEETGVLGAVVGLAGVLDEEWEGEARRRWVYLLRGSGELPDGWAWTCDCGAPVWCRWLAPGGAVHPAQQGWLELARAWVSGAAS